MRAREASGAERSKAVVDEAFSQPYLKSLDAPTAAASLGVLVPALAAHLAALAAAASIPSCVRLH